MMERRKNLNDKFGFVEIMEYTSIGESCSVVSGGTPSRSKNEYWENGNIPWIKIGNIKSKYVNEYDELITEQGLNNSSAKLLKKGTILYTIFATLGEVAILDIEACTNQAIAGINITNPRITTDYLYYYLKSKKDYVNNIGRGVAQNNINLTTLKNFEIPLIDVDKQLNIVEILEKVERMICLKEKEIDDLDLLIKARFVEMFGDPIINSKKLPTKSVINVVTLQRGYDLPNKERHKDGIIPLYGANGQFDWHDTSKACHGIITGRSGSIGQVYYCETEFWPLNTTLFSVDNHGNNIIYLSYLLDFFDLKRFSNGTGVPTLNRNLIHKENIIDVPLISQNQFADFVQQVDKSREEVKKSLEKTQQLYDSLMQEYFG